MLHYFLAQLVFLTVQFFGQSMRRVKSTCKAISIAGFFEIPKATQSYPDAGILYTLKRIIK